MIGLGIVAACTENASSKRIFCFFYMYLQFYHELCHALMRLASSYSTEILIEKGMLKLIKNLRPICMVQVYIAELMESLLQCMFNLSTPSTLVLFAYYERSATAGRVFWDLLPSYFSYEKIPEDSYGAGAHPGNLGLFSLKRNLTQGTRN